MSRLLFLVAPILFSLAVFVGFSVYDLVVLGRVPHAEGPPLFDAYYLVRDVAAISLSALLVTAVIRSTASSRTDVRNDSRWMLWSGVFAVFGMLSLVGMFLVSPRTLSTLGREDNVIEWASAICALAGAAFMLRVAFSRATRQDLRFGPYTAMAAFFALLLFLLGMEELSWFQRVVDLDTPELMSANLQNEINLHNFATNEVETLYYLASFTFLIFLPFVVDRLRPPISPGLTAFIPTTAVVLVAAPQAALNYDMWDIIPIQMTFWMTLFILVSYAARSRAEDTLWSFVWLASAASLLAAQAVFLGFGDRFLRLYDVTEYKEAFIAIGFLVFSLQVAYRASCSTPAKGEGEIARMAPVAN